MNATPAVLFTANWHIYQTIIRENYMLHRELADATRVLLDRWKEQMIRVLDLGCGDAQQIGAELTGRNISYYKGVDLSPYALKQAEIFTKNINAEVQLVCGDMALQIKSDPDQYDLLYSSYAVHHLVDPEKRILLKHCYERLKPGGLFILIDIMKQDGQTRDQYAEHYIDGIYHNWSALDLREKKMVADHIRQCDLPATATDMINWSEAIGYRTTRVALNDDRHGMLVLEKA